MQQSLVKQDTIVSKKVPPFEDTFLESSFVATRIPSWQAHLQRISPFLRHEENVWWKADNNGYQFFDADIDTESHQEGPHLLHFSQAQLTDVEIQQSRVWDNILKTTLCYHPLAFVFTTRMEIL